MANKKHLFTFRGETLSLSEWSKKTGVPPSTILSRLKLGWSIGDALTRPRQVERLPEAIAVKIPTMSYHSSGQARVWHNGGYIYLGKWGSPQAAARYEQLVRDIRRQAERALLPAAKTPSVAQLTEAFWAHCRQHYTKHGKPTAEVYCFKRAIDALLLTCPGLQARDFGPVQLREVRAEILRQPGRKKHGQQTTVTRAYANEQINRVRRIWAWGVEQGLIPLEVYQALQVVKGLRRGKTTAPESKKIKPVAWEHVEKTIPHLPADLQAMVRIHWLLGCRAKESYIMRPCDIDRSDPDAWLYKPWTSKVEDLEAEGEELAYWIGPQGQTLLRPWLERCSSAEAFVFPGPQGHQRTGQALGRWDKDSYGRAVEKACQAAGVPSWSPRQIRKGRANQVRDLEHQAGRDGRAAAQAALGHKQASTTEQHYLQQLQLAREIQKRLG